MDYNTIRFKNPLDKVYICLFCHFIYNEVYQACCGCRFCSDCIETILLYESCASCKESFSEKLKRKDKAFKRDLDNCNVECIDCNWKGTLQEYLKHYVELHKIVICKYCKVSFSELSLLAKHLECYKNGSCKALNVGNKRICNKIGCDITNLSDSEYLEHINKDFHKHVDNLYNMIQKGIVSNQNVESNSNYSNTNQNVLESTNEFSETVQTYLHKIVANESKLIEKLSKRSSTQAGLKKDLSILKKNFNLVNLHAIQIEQDVISQEKATDNGWLLWKITEIDNKIKDSKNGKQTSFYSPAFYSHPNGYKMCARIYLNGDGMGRGTHLSVFFVLMKGEFDSLLKWPFSQKVTFVLIDQLESESKENVVDAFRPDPNSSSFIMPNNDMNIASGIPLFCPLTKLHSPDHKYINDDTMFIKVVLETRMLSDV